MPPLHLSTILTRKPSSLLSHIGDVSLQYAGKGHTILFTLSSNFTLPQDLQTAVDRLAKFNDVDDIGQRTENKKKSRGHTIGCLTDSFASATFERLPVTKDVKHPEDPLLSCSIGIFDSSFCIPYRSELPGRAQPQVGRWHSFRNKEIWAADNGGSGLGKSAGEGWEPDWQNMKAKKNKGEMNWEDIWNRSVSTSCLQIQLFPEKLRRVKPSKIQTLLTLSSPHPDSLSHALSDFSPNSPSLTLLAAPTHFITGRKVTLFLDGRIFGDGAVGLALLKAEDQAEEKSVTCRTEFLGMKRISGPMTVTSREGNMINELNSSNPTKLLLSALELAGISPSSTTFRDEDQFALGVLAPSGQVSRTYKITAGDPSARGGSLSLDAQSAPHVGSIVQFLHFPSNSPIVIPASFLPSLVPLDGTGTASKKKVLAALTVAEPLSSPSASSSHSPSTEATAQILNDTFLIPSAQGFVLSRRSKTLSVPEDISKPVEAKSASAHEAGPWTCSIPGGAVLLEF